MPTRTLTADRCSSAEPNGWVQICELDINTLYCDDDTMSPDDDRNESQILMNSVKHTSRLIEYPQDYICKLKQSFEEAGFVDTRVKTVKEPIGPWPKYGRLKKIGTLALILWEAFYGTYGKEILKRDEIPHDVVDTDFSAALVILYNKNYHLYNVYYNVCGRKPVDQELGKEITVD
ncbi:Similar to hypothetical protein [Tuber melanosporum Mel28]; acc. no. XP_002839213 [Pyronema omphalodes CBS 100304]|uniref:Uncharacterized protein n=1 Tax=Pyronema omphalodes (strain CBS 100304) TaxID=1076935 RepID=U4L3G8_PYROM|nr:Similar to hypothetical protein [Tuber melanosporum Mel28]; acc. no. XP_002839213 [Pyronema omphalodes CBS 100304]